MTTNLPIPVQLPELIQLPKLYNWGDDAWRKDAACKGVDTKIFFPEKGPLSVVHASKSKSYCMGCSVRFPCLKFAVENYMQVGTYGGVSPNDRREITKDNLNEDMVKFSLQEGYAILKRSKDEAPVATLARLTGETEEWVKEHLANDFDYRF